MKKYINSIMGLVSGLTLMILNNDIVHSSLGSVITLFDPTNLNKVTIFLLAWTSRLIVVLSFIGTIITITCSFLIIKKIVK